MAKTLKSPLLVAVIMAALGGLFFLFTNHPPDLFSFQETTPKSPAKLYQYRCAACHGPQGQGSIGPNLTDEYWIHGKGDFESIERILRIGVLEKGMPAWQNILTPEQLTGLTEYLQSLQGTTPPNPKAPQGQKL